MVSGGVAGRAESGDPVLMDKLMPTRFFGISPLPSGKRDTREASAASAVVRTALLLFADAHESNGSTSIKGNVMT